jgi:hypothetical protein
MKPLYDANKACFTKSPADMKKVYQHMQALSNPSSDSVNLSGIENITNSEINVESDELSNGDLVNKIKDFSKYFKSYTRYVVEFSHVAKSNITKLALGGRDPYQLEWILEIEPFSQFSYAMMRQNILSLCIED